MKLGLGTVQFGLPYGITNQAGVPSDQELQQISDSLDRLGIGLIDTAYNYGNCEERIGALGWASRPNLRIVTKCPSVSSEKELLQRLKESLTRLRGERVYGYLLHDAGNLRGNSAERVAEGLRQVREDGLADKIGVSVYSAEEALEIYQRFPFHLVQLPLNVLDQRALKNGSLSRLNALGVEIHVRSAFLQGALIGDPARLPPSMSGLRARVENFQFACQQRGISPAMACLSFLSSVPEVSYAVVGITSCKELEELCEQSKMLMDPAWFEKFGEIDPAIIDPRAWPKK